VERRVYEFLQERDPVLAEEVRKSMFVFEDIAKLDQRALQLVLRELTSQEIAVALKRAADELRELVFENVSENSAKTIREELELLGPVRVSQVEEAQQKVVSTVRRLAEEGTINMRGGDDEEVIS
jgi:flagellar motor switch protein FliG